MNQEEPLELENSHQESAPDSGLYRALMAHYLHQDRMVWTSIQFLVALQGGVLAGGYALRTSWVGPMILVFGASLNLLLRAYSIKASLDRDVNLKIMDELARRLVDRDLGGYHLIRVTEKAPWWLPRGATVLKTVVVSFTALDVILSYIFLFRPGLIP